MKYYHQPLSKTKPEPSMSHVIYFDAPAFAHQKFRSHSIPCTFETLSQSSITTFKSTTPHSCNLRRKVPDHKEAQQQPYSEHLELEISSNFLENSSDSLQISSTFSLASWDSFHLSSNSWNFSTSATFTTDQSYCETSGHSIWEPRSLHFSQSTNQIQESSLSDFPLPPT